MKGQRFLREDWQCYLEEPVCSFSLFLPPAATSYKSQNHKGSQLEHNVCEQTKFQLTTITNTLLKKSSSGSTNCVDISVNSSIPMPGYKIGKQ